MKEHFESSSILPERTATDGHNPADVPDSLVAALDEYLRRCESGESPDRDEFLSRFADLRTELADCLDGLAFVEQFAPEFRKDAANVVVPANAEDSARPSANTHSVLGDFRIVRELGRGGMGVVYEAEQLSLGRRVALKVLPFASLLDKRQLARFQNEARAAAMLKHPQIVSVFQTGYDRGVHYYAMELMEGRTLAEEIEALRNSGVRQIGLDRQKGDTACDSADGEDPAARETVPFAGLSTQSQTERKESYRSVARLGIQAADSLQYAHEHGMIHRDIKPSNLLFDADGELHITDFGLVRMQSGSDLTVSGDLVGTLRYMSPEQVAGDRFIDQRTDIYSLGLTLYEFIARAPAFQQTSRHELIKAIEQTEPARLNRLDKHVPVDLATIVHKAISKDPENRYQQASEMADDLRCFLDHRSISAKRSTRFERLTRLAKRNPLVATLTSTVLLLLVTLSIISTALAWQYSSTAAEQSRRSERQLRDARKQELGLYARDMRLARFAIDGAEPLHAEQLLLRWVPETLRLETGQEDLRGIEWYHLWARCHNSPDHWMINYQNDVRAVAFSPDGRFLANATIAQEIAIWDAVDRNRKSPVQLLTLPVFDTKVLKTIQQNGLLIGGGGAGVVTIWRWDTYEEIESFPVQSDHERNMVFAVDMSPAQDMIAAIVSHGHQGWSVGIWDRHDRRYVTRARYAGNAWAGFDRAGQLISGSDATATIDVINPRTGEVTKQFPLTGTCDAGAVGPNRKCVALCLSRELGDLSESWLELRNLDDWQLILQRSLVGTRATRIAFPDDGQEIAVGSTDGQILQIDKNSPRILRRTVHDGPVASIDYSPDGQHIASAGRTRNACVMPRAAPRALPLEITRCQELNPSVVTGIGFLDEGRTVCSSEGAHVVHIWDAYSGELRGEPIELEKGPWNLMGIQTDPLRGRIAIVQTNWPFDSSTDDAGNRTNAIPGRVTIWNHKTKRSIGVFDFDDEIFIHSFPFSNDGRYVGVCGVHTLSVIDLQTGTHQEIYRSPAWVHTCDFSPDGRYLVCGMTNGEVQRFDVGTWALSGKPFMADSQLTECVRYSPDSRLLGACGFDCRLRLFDSSTHKLIVESEPTPMYHSLVRFSPDGLRVAVGSPEGKVRVYMTESADEVLSIGVPNQYPFFDFSQDGNSLAIAAVYDAMVVHGPNRKLLAPLSVSKLRDIACQNVTTMRRSR